MNKKILDLLYRSFDAPLAEEEKRLLENALQQSEELRQEKAQIAAIRNMAHRDHQTSFAPFFPERVMNRIESITGQNQIDPFFDSIYRLFKPLAIAAIILIIAVAGYNMGSSGNFSLEGLLAVPEVTVDDAYDPSLALIVEEE
jgi:hypothetical protein